MELCAFSVFWLITTFSLVVVYVLDLYPSLIPIISSLFRWGKLRIGYVDGSRKFYEVPKRWYQHFYITGIVTNGTILTLVCLKLFWGHPFPGCFTTILKWLQFPVNKTDVTDAMPVLLVLVMDQVQVLRRSYETFFVNIFSATATMTLLHYILGIVFYLSFGLCVLTGTDFEQLQIKDVIEPQQLTLCMIAVCVFLVANIIQHQSFKILASLRINKKDSVNYAGYMLPRGGLFEYVSCPHFFAEMVIYISFNMVFHFSNPVLLSLGIFVIVNQSIAAITTHQCRGHGHMTTVSAAWITGDAFTLSTILPLHAFRSWLHALFRA